MNHTFEEKVWCMLFYVKLLKSFRGEVVKTAVDIISMLPLVSLDEEISENVWLGKVSYNHLNVFRCQIFVYILNDDRTNLISKTQECINLKSLRDKFGYWFWDQVNKRIAKSWDFVFFEDQTIEDVKNKILRPRAIRNFDPKSSHMAHDNYQREDLHESNSEPADLDALEELNWGDPQEKDNQTLEITHLSM